MNRAWTWLVGPETVLLAVGAWIWIFVGRHHSGEGRDIELLERLVWLLPVMMVPLAFATLAVPGARQWWWLARAVVVSLTLLSISAARVIEGFGMGAKGQDVAFMVCVGLGVFLVAPAAAASGAYILAGEEPGFAVWFRSHWILGALGTLLAAVPLGLGIGIVTCVGVVGVGLAWSAATR